MKISFYFKLAADNIRKNGRTYVPYILTCIMTIMMFYIMKSLSLNPGLSEIYGGGVSIEILGFGNWVITLFSAIFLFYTNSFLIKSRKKEFGVFNILGMEKRHVAGVIFIETLYITLISLVFGIGLGILFDKLMYLVIAKCVGAEISLGFFISPKAIYTTSIVFGAVYLAILIRSIFLIQLSNPIELLRGGNVGEKEPKAKWFLALLGLVCIGAGYYISITTDNPLQALTLFFFAVVLVILGTYLIFTAGSIAFLKILRRNKGYYYKTKHFISVSGMIYRMKQNAVGLANICVLSTMVLVMVSSTTSLIIGMNDIINQRFTSDISAYAYEYNMKDVEILVDEIHKLQSEKNLDVENEVMYQFLEIISLQNDDNFVTDFDDSDTGVIADNLIMVEIMSLDDYNRLCGVKESLDKDEILMFTNKFDYDYPTVKVLDKNFKINQKIDSFYLNGRTNSFVYSTCGIVVSDDSVLSELDEKISGLNGEEIKKKFFYGFDLNADEDAQIKFYDYLIEQFKHNEKVSFEGKAEGRIDFLSLYGGLFFLGLFLGTLFTMATALIIYYKQISEGIDDRERFEIMKKVGLSRSEIKSAIHSQILTVFFMPLLTAGVHVLAAFPIISRLLTTLNMTNTKLYVYCTIGSIAAFALIYVIIYFMTSKSYYKLVSDNRS